MRARRNTKNNSIAIICEGSDTEYNYCTDIMNYVQRRMPNRFSKVLILPRSREADDETKRKSKRAKRNISPKLPNTTYYELSDEEYEKYKPEPLRYAREAQLYLEKYGYTESWAVFDKDNHNPEFDEEAFNMEKSVPDLHIAFSSFCIEEWFLMHFEYNRTDYRHSECKDKGNKYIGCGKNIKGNTKDCKGERCVIGRIRECGYIENYEKNMPGLFNDYTLKNISSELNLCFFNAARMRAEYSSHEIWTHNPYVNIDIFVAKMLEVPLYHCISKVNDDFVMNCYTKLLITKKAPDVVEIDNKGTRSFACNKSCVRRIHYDPDGRNIKYAAGDVQNCIIQVNEKVELCFDDNTNGYMIIGKNTILFAI